MKKIIKDIIPAFILNGYRKHQNRKKIKFYEGDKVTCPICNSHFKMFAPSASGLEKRKNAKCLTCGSKERHRLLFLYFREKTNIFDDSTKKTLLHFAPEKPFYEILSKKQNIEYIPCDLFPETYNFKGKTKVSKVDINKIPFEENYFDIVLCNHVLEHVPTDKQAMSELYRVMKKGGWGIFQVPIDYKKEKTYEDFSITSPKEREKAFGQYDHVRWYGRDYKDKLKNAGFNVTVDDYIKKFSSEELSKFGLSSSHLIYYCTK
jgi:SAM-dependent methyltransferase